MPQPKKFSELAPKTMSNTVGSGSFVDWHRPDARLEALLHPIVRATIGTCRRPVRREYTGIPRNGTRAR